MAIADVYVDILETMFYENLRQIPPNLRDYVEDHSARIANGGTTVKIPTYAERQVKLHDLDSDRVTMQQSNDLTYGNNDLNLENTDDNKRWYTRFAVPRLDTRDAMLDLISRGAMDASRETMLEEGNFIRTKLDAALEANSNKGQIGADIDVSKLDIGNDPGTLAEKKTARDTLIRAIYSARHQSLIKYWESLGREWWCTVSPSVYKELLEYFVDVARFGTGQINDEMLRGGNFLSTMLGFNISIDYGIPIVGAAGSTPATKKQINRIYFGTSNYGIAWLEKRDGAEQRWVADKLEDEYIMYGRWACKVWNPDSIGAVYLTNNAVA